MLFADGMKARRQQLGMTQKELCDRSSVPQSTISAIERGSRKPTEDTMVMIAKGLNCTVSDLLGENKPAEYISGLDQNIIDIMVSLPPEDHQRMRDFAAGLIAARKAPLSPK